jgi:diguanylate cyclase (GGDEF)-like protein
VAHRACVDHALAFLARGTPDMIVLDLGLPDAGGVEAVRKVQLAAPLVVLTGLDDEAAAIQALHAGAQDYLIKGQLSASSLLRALRYALERHGLQIALRKESTIDELTGLANRRGFLMLAEQHAMLAKRTGEQFVVAFIDMDRLKPINDTLGHQAGDAAIAEIAEALRVCFRGSDILGRLGGDEFAALLPATDDNSEASIRLRLAQELQARNARPDRRYSLCVSIGIVRTEHEHPVSIEEMLAQADALMYEEKRGRAGR